MAERSLIQISASKYPKGLVLDTPKEADLLQYPQMVVPNKPLKELVREITRAEAESREKKDGDFSYRSFPEDHEYYEVLEEFYYYEPSNVSGFSFGGGYVSGADYDIQMSGVWVVFEDIMDELHRDFQPFFVKAKEHSDNGFASWNKQPEDVELHIECVGVLDFGHSYSYDGEYDCWTEYAGLLDMSSVKVLPTPSASVTETGKAFPI